MTATIRWSPGAVRGFRDVVLRCDHGDTRAVIGDDLLGGSGYVTEQLVSRHVARFGCMCPAALAEAPDADHPTPARR